MGSIAMLDLSGLPADDERGWAPVNRLSMLIKGGSVLRDSGDLEESDVGVAGDTVVDIRPDIDPALADRVIDGTGCIVSAGLVDLHGHFLAEAWPIAVDPDEHCLSSGVTTAVDAGTLGWIQAPIIREYLDGHYRTNLYALLHVSSLGLLPLASGVPELADPRTIQHERAVRAVIENCDRVLGVKLRMTSTAMAVEDAEDVLRRSVAIADAADCLLMVHVTGTPIPLANILEVMRPGDVITHIFAGGSHTLLDSRGDVRPEIWTARERGVAFDIAVGALGPGQSGHFDESVARASIAQGFYPDTLSTDMHHPPQPGKFQLTLPELMSLMLDIGMPLSQVLSSVTSAPAMVLGVDGIGHLREGASADIAILEVGSETTNFAARFGVEAAVRQQFRVAATVRGGALVHG